MRESPAKERILDVASRLFYEQGYNSTGINQIIDEADIARASLYKYFPSKKHLLTAYVERAEDKWFSNMENYLSGIEDPKAKLLAIFDFREERQIKSGFGGCQFNKVGAEIPKDDLITFEQVSHQKDRLKLYITALLQRIDLKNSSALSIEMLVEAIFLLMEGSTVAASMYKGEASIKNAKIIAASLI